MLIFDDSIEEKPYTDENEIINWHFDHWHFDHWHFDHWHFDHWHFDHCQSRLVKGVNLLTALYHSDHSGDVSLPVDFDLIQKTELVTDAKNGCQNRQRQMAE